MQFYIKRVTRRGTEYWSHKDGWNTVMMSVSDSYLDMCDIAIYLYGAHVCIKHR